MVEEDVQRPVDETGPLFEGEQRTGVEHPGVEQFLEVVEALQRLLPLVGEDLARQLTPQRAHVPLRANIVLHQSMCNLSMPSFDLRYYIIFL